MRLEPDIIIVHYKSVCSVTVSIGEISFSLLERLDAWEWGSRAITSLLCSPLTRCNFRFKPAGKTINLDREAASSGREAATPTALGARGVLKLPQRVRAEPGRQTFSGAF